MLIGLWVRSSHTLDFLEWSKTKFGWTIAVTSFDGECELMFATYNEIWSGTKPGSTYLTRPERFATWDPSPFGFANNGISNGNYFLMLPYWFLLLAAAFATSVPWMPWKFSLRALLIATTLIAVGPGLVVSLWP